MSSLGDKCSKGSLFRYFKKQPSCDEKLCENEKLSEESQHEGSRCDSVEQVSKSLSSTTAIKSDEEISEKQTIIHKHDVETSLLAKLKAYNDSLKTDSVDECKKSAGPELNDFNVDNNDRDSSESNAKFSLRHCDGTDDQFVEKESFSDNQCQNQSDSYPQNGIKSQDQPTDNEDFKPESASARDEKSRRRLRVVDVSSDDDFTPNSKRPKRRISHRPVSYANSDSNSSGEDEESARRKTSKTERNGTVVLKNQRKMSFFFAKCKDNTPSDSSSIGEIPNGVQPETLVPEKQKLIENQESKDSPKKRPLDCAENTSTPTEPAPEKAVESVDTETTDSGVPLRRSSRRAVRRPDRYTDFHSPPINSSPAAAPTDTPSPKTDGKSRKLARVGKKSRRQLALANSSDSDSIEEVTPSRSSGRTRIRPGVNAFQLMRRAGARKPTAADIELERAKREFLASGKPEVLVQQDLIVSRVQQSTMAMFPPVQHVRQLTTAETDYGDHPLISSTIHGYRLISQYPPITKPSHFSLVPLPVTEFDDVINDDIRINWTKISHDLFESGTSTLLRACGSRCGNLMWSTAHALAVTESADVVSEWLGEWSCGDYDGDPGSSDEEPESSRALLLLGPPGAGKTQSVYKAAEQMNYQVLEVNTGSVRSGKQLNSQLSECSRSRELSRHRLLLVEDVLLSAAAQDDGMKAALNQLVTGKSGSRQIPLIMTSNSDEEMSANIGRKSRVRNSSVVASLPPNDTRRFSLPSRDSLASHLVYVAAIHERWISPSLLHDLLNESQCDPRRSLLKLQVLCQGQDPTVIQPIVTTDSDETMNAEEVLRQRIEKSLGQSLYVLHTKRKLVGGRGAHTISLKNLSDICDTRSYLDQLSSISRGDMHWWECHEQPDMGDTFPSRFLHEENRQCLHRHIIDDVAAISDTLYLGHRHQIDKNPCDASVSSLYRQSAAALPIQILSRRALVADTLPYMRQICKLEFQRRFKDGARSRRFFHYFDQVGLHSVWSELRAAWVDWFE